ncbi:NUDIX domain-containing protein [Microbacterium sp. KUDC0406]|uniref:NUDIX hydrolase n=1 Tax=Microbacterium sp. KUDC0406 TaxID=2909588 RepID=UPI001F16DACD|nr:NUDIX domain-containing protein [Microbacterium sp. KUDC0406]UJP08801.1 NUDIX domain-containing protein [Microbacterium sp. KUDC0406]
MPDIHVSAAVITDSEGRALLVRKNGTERFMQPGGKPETGETAAETLVRELREELGLVVFQDQLRPLGTFVSDAANEPGHRVVATVFAMTAEPEEVVVQAELAELRWIAESEQGSLPLAPLSEEHLLPIAWA